MIAKPNGKILKINDIDKNSADELIYVIEKEYEELPLIVGFNEEKNEKFLYPEKLNVYQKA